MVKHVNTKEFDEIIEKGLVVVDFFATWCGPCKMVAPIFEEISNAHEDITFIKVDVDQYPDLAARYQVSTIPTIIVSKDKKIMDKTIGFVPKSQLEEKILLHK